MTVSLDFSLARKDFITQLVETAPSTARSRAELDPEHKMSPSCTTSLSDITTDYNNDAMHAWVCMQHLKKVVTHTSVLHDPLFNIKDGC